MRKVLALVALSVASIVAGCGEDAATASRCLSVSPVILRGIEEGLTVSGGGSLRGGQAVRSEDFERAYFVAADIEGAGMDGKQVGLWVTNRLDEAVTFYSVNSMAKEFSDWGDGGSTDAEFSTSNDGASEAEDCV